MKRVKKAPYTVDLHAHTTCSDGALSPTQLVEFAARRGVRHLSITDHDTTAGLVEARAVAATHGVQIIDGIELSVWQGKVLHLLGYFVDPEDPALAEWVGTQSEARRQRIRRICELLAALGMPVEAEAILGAARHNAGRPHVARALKRAGHVRSYEEAFQRWLGAGKPAYVASSHLPLAEGIALIHGAGGVAGLAHPGVEGVDGAIPAMVEAGLDALECAHPAHRAATAARYRTLAGLYGLCATGGSDFHDGERGAAPGSHGVEPIVLAHLHARRRAA